MASKKSKQTGVTLVELMVTLIVLGVAIAIAIPSFVGYRQRQAVKAAAEEYIALLAQERMEAVKRNRTWRINFNTVTGRLPTAASLVGAPSMAVGTDTGQIEIDPKLGTLSADSSEGALTVGVGPYRLTFQVNIMGRGTLCVPTTGSLPVPGYPSCA